jgi:uncharacterized protein (TIGR02266 family)
MSVARAIDTSDKRYQRRLPVRINVEYEDTADFLTDYTANVSIGGMFIETEEPLAVGTHFRLRFTVPSRVKPIDTIAEVRWAQPRTQRSTLNPGMGVRFQELSNADFDAVQEMLVDWI